MIKVTYNDSDNHITRLEVKGHAEFDKSGKDLICAGVSSIIFGLLNALDEKKDVIIEEKNNRIAIKNDSSDITVDNYLELVLIQLKTIEESYGEYLKIERK